MTTVDITEEDSFINYKSKMKDFDIREYIHFPRMNVCDILAWYKPTFIIKDLLNAILVAMVLIPQSIADASIAGLDPEYGLYTSILPLAVYSFFGTCRQLAVGPVALLSILVSSSGLDKEQIFVATFFSGIVQIILGVLKLGSLINFFSHSIIKGVICAASLVIITSQMFTLVGIEKVADKSLWNLLYTLFQNVDVFHIPTVVASILNGILLLVLSITKNKFDIKLLPVPLILLCTNIILFASFGISDTFGIEVLGEFSFSLPQFTQLQIGNNGLTYTLIAESVLFACIGYVESITIAKSLSAENKYVIDTNQELFSIGLMNFVSSFFQCFVSTGSFSRSIISNYNKTKSQFSNLFCSLLILLFSLYLKGLLFYLPKCVISCIIVNSFLKYFDVKTPLYFWKINKKDFTTWIVAFVTSVSFGLQYGILTGLILSLLILINQITQPHWARLGEVKSPHDESLIIYRNIRRYKTAKLIENVEIIRFDSFLNFANIGYYKEVVDSVINNDRHIKYLILDFSVISSLDATAINGLTEMYNDLDVHIFFCCMRGPVRDMIKKSGMLKHIYNHPPEITCEECATHFHTEICEVVKYIQSLH